jgi:integrase
MPARALTDVEVRSLKSEPDQRLVVYDQKARGLCLRVTARTKSWSFIYRPKGRAKQKRYTIGDYPAWSLSEARSKALALRRQVQDGGDPVAEVRTRRDALTVSGMVERFVSKAKKRLRSWETYESLLNRDVIPVMGDRPAGDVSRAEVANMLDKIAERAPVVANRVQNTLSSVFSWAVSEGLVLTNPVRGLRKRHDEVAKERVLSDEEVQALWRATGAMAPAYRDVLRLILLTGQRPGEVAGIQREEVDLEKALWTLPPERVKNKRRHLVPLVGEALSIVRGRAEGGGAGPLITTPRGHTPTSQDVAKAFERLRAEGIFNTPATPHDLRRTAATLMGRLEIDQMTIARVLNHASTTKATVTGSTYDRHTYEPQMRRALEALDSEVRRILSGIPFPSNVLPLSRAQG